jgi:hypothetical protein
LSFVDDGYADVSPLAALGPALLVAAAPEEAQ